MALYFLIAKPMTDRAMRAVVARPPPFPAQHQKAVFEARLQRSDGSQMDLSTMRGKVVVLNVWATWCPPCMAELPSFAKLAAHYAGQEDLKVVCVSGEQVSRIWPKMSAHEAALILFSTDGHRLPAVYQTNAIPATFVINKGGEIVFQHVGSANWASEDTFRFLDNLRKGEPNQSADSTPSAGTSAAGQPRAPASAASHP
jgi:thiol-disulfide isomerase/thioredoxin